MSKDHFEFRLIEPLKHITNNIKNSIKYKEHFETENYYYIIL